MISTMAPHHRRQGRPARAPHPLHVLYHRLQAQGDLTARHPVGVGAGAAAVRAAVVVQGAAARAAAAVRVVAARAPPPAAVAAAVAVGQSTHSGQPPTPHPLPPLTVPDCGPSDADQAGRGGWRGGGPCGRGADLPGHGAPGRECRRRSRQGHLYNPTSPRVPCRNRPRAFSEPSNRRSSSSRTQTARRAARSRATSRPSRCRPAATRSWPRTTTGSPASSPWPSARRISSITTRRTATPTRLAGLAALSTQRQRSLTPPPHARTQDHLIYVLEGDGVTIYPGGDESAAMVVPLQVGAGIPAPMSAPPFAKHTLLNSGTVPLKMVFFEAKK